MCPALHGPAPRETPIAFAAAERQELELNRPGAALESYRKLAAEISLRNCWPRWNHQIKSNCL